MLDRAVQALALAPAPIALAPMADVWRWSRAARSVAAGWTSRMSPEEALPTMRTDPRVMCTTPAWDGGAKVLLVS